LSFSCLTTQYTPIDCTQWVCQQVEALQIQLDSVVEGASSLLVLAKQKQEVLCVALKYFRCLIVAVHLPYRSSQVEIPTPPRVQIVLAFAIIAASCFPFTFWGRSGKTAATIKKL